MTTILVTGGAGFIGSNFVHYMTRKYPDYAIIILDALTYAGSVDNLPAEFEGNKVPGREFWYGDVTNADLVDSLVKRSDNVVHFAAESVSSDTFIPVHDGRNVKLYNIEDLFVYLSRKHKVEVNSEGVEFIELPKSFKTLGYCRGMGSWRSIKYITRHKYKGDIFRLRQKWGEITATPNHSIYASSGLLTKPENNPELLSVRKIDWNKYSKRNKLHIKHQMCRHSGGRVFIYGKKGAINKSSSLPYIVEKEHLKTLVKFLGFYCAEGSASFNKANGCYITSLCNKRRDLLDSLKKGMDDIISSPSGIVYNKPIFQLAYSSKLLYTLVRDWCGVGSGEKKVPDFIFTLCREYQELFLEWYLLGDGNCQQYVNTNSWRASSTSKFLLTGIGFLCTILSKDFTVGYKKGSMDGRNKESYTIKLVTTYGKEESQKEIKKIDYDGYVYDLTVDGTENFCSGFGFVVAHNTHVTRSIYDNKLFFHTDVVGTQTIANAVCKYKSNIDRFIHISTSEVYGTAVSCKMNEEHPLNPASPYAAAKAGADRLVYSYWNTYKIPAVIVRPFNNYGPRQHLEKAIPRFITSVILNEKIHLHGDGSAARDYIHVDDTCFALDTLLHAPEGKVVGEVFNIGSEVDRSIMSIAKDITSLMGGGKYVNIGDRPGQVFRHTADCTKIHGMFGWKPQVTWLDGLGKTIDWYNNNGSMWAKQRWLREIPIITADGKKEMH